MTDRQKLIQLLDTNFGWVDPISADTLADKLIANGVIFKQSNQSPLTQKDLKIAKVGWIEFRFGKKPFPVLILPPLMEGFSIRTALASCTDFIPWERYGKTVRIWASEPTKEEKETTSWRDLNSD